MEYDILLKGNNGERLVDFAASGEVKDRKVKNYIRSFAGYSQSYNAYKVIVRSRDTNVITEEHEL
jgi:hypothetical protein